jgi:hypothetical protein
MSFEIENCYFWGDEKKCIDFLNSINKINSKRKKTLNSIIIKNLIINGADKSNPKINNITKNNVFESD